MLSVLIVLIYFIVANMDLKLGLRVRSAFVTEDKTRNRTFVTKDQSYGEKTSMAVGTGYKRSLALLGCHGQVKKQRYTALVGEKLEYIY